MRIIVSDGTFLVHGEHRVTADVVWTSLCIFSLLFHSLLEEKLFHEYTPSSPTFVSII